MKQRLYLYGLLLLIFLFPETLLAEQPRILEREGVRILYEEPLRAAATETADLFPAVKQDLERTLGWVMDFKPAVFLIRQTRTFQQMVGTDLVVAVALPQKALILIDYSKMQTDPFSIASTLKHELCHLLLHRHIQSVDLPRWLDEGVAQWVSGGIAEIIVNQERSYLQAAVLSDRIIDIRTLSAGFPEDRQGLFLAYEESKSLVEYMVSEFGVHGLLDTLENLRVGLKWQEALERGLSIPFDELLTGWRQQLENRTSWFTYLSYHLYEILFFAAALMMVYGFIRAYRKKKAYIDDYDPD